MAPSQLRLLTAENSCLGKVPDLSVMLQNEQAWITLPREVREQLYTLLPPLIDSEPPRDLDKNPLAIERLKPYIEAELKRWQGDLQDGRETKKWRQEAMQAGKDHTDGKFDDWKFLAREEYWGKPGGEEDATVKKTEDEDDQKTTGAQANGESSNGGGEATHGTKANGATNIKEDSDGSIEIMDSDDEEGEL